jgi:hypothetical protein
MRASLCLCVVAGLLSFGCGKKDSASQSTNASSSGNPVTAPVDYLGAISKAKRATERTLDTVGINQAIQLFHAQEGRYPNNLGELVSKQYIGALPAPPAGMKYEYNSITGQVKVVPQ